MHNKLLTYATPDFLANAENLAHSALACGFDSAEILQPKDITETDFFKSNQHILSQARGAGYWLWKPYIILEALRRASNNDVVLYCDAGRSSYYHFTRFPNRLFEMARRSDEGFILGPMVPHLGKIRHWTKRDCLILMDADKDKLLDKGLLMTWSLWRPTEASYDFLQKWLTHCQDPRCLTDQTNICGLPNHIGFRDHRHDQSIFSLLAHRESAPHLDFSNTLTQRVIDMRPGSSLSHHFYKRPENADQLLTRDNPLMLIREFIRLKMATG